MCTQSEFNYAVLAEVKAGDLLVADGGSTCLCDGDICTVQTDEDGYLFIPCRDGGHYLIGQLDAAGRPIGLTPVTL